jgi:hypothetical protein
MSYKAAHSTAGGMSLKLILNSGRKISLAMLRQNRTYEGHLAGYPHKRMNDDTIELLLAEAPKLTLDQGKPLLIDPVISVRDLGARAFMGPEERMPEVACVARFDSDALAKLGSEPYSSLTIVWFQEAFGVPTETTILEQIRAIDWENRATDWCW